MRWRRTDRLCRVAFGVCLIVAFSGLPGAAESGNANRIIILSDDIGNTMPEVGSSGSSEEASSEAAPPEEPAAAAEEDGGKEKKEQKKKEEKEEKEKKDKKEKKGK